MMLTLKNAFRITLWLAATSVVSSRAEEKPSGLPLPAPGGQGAADRPATRIISADLQRIRGPLNRMFQACVGAGRANEGLRADWQRQLAYVRRECGFQYLRMHGLLCDDMGVYREDKAGRAIYNWQYIDELFDCLLSLGMKPFVELSFMPSALASGTQTIFWWKGNVTQPKDLKKWAELIRALTAHWTERYGEAEVRTWYFEVWNEPNLPAFFAGTQADYFNLYAATARAVKAVSAAYRVGGPATAGCGWIPEFIDYCVKNQVPVDFVSTHTYAVDQGYLDEFGEHGTVLSLNPEAITAEVRQSREQIRRSALPQLELHFTEWSTSYTPSDPVHDSYHSAAFILDKIRNIGAAADSMSYWVFTDIFEEAGPRATPFHGGFGLINYQDINKPAFYAYQFLNRLGATELQCDDRAAWVCTDDRGGVQVLFWDFTITHPGASVINQQFYRRDLPPAKATTVALRLAGIAPGQYALSVFKTGYRINDAYATYRDMRAPPQLTKPQVAIIRSTNSGEPVAQTLVTVGGDGIFQRDIELRENDVCLLQLDRV